MIDAVTYGMIPSAKTEKRESAPPEKRFSRPRTRAALAVKELLIWSESTPGAGTQRAEAVEREDERGEEDALAQLRHAPGVGEPGEHGYSSLSSSGAASASGGGLSSAGSVAASASGAFAFALRFFFFFALVGSRSSVDGAAGGFDLLARGRRDAVRGDGRASSSARRRRGS